MHRAFLSGAIILLPADQFLHLAHYSNLCCFIRLAMSKGFARPGGVIISELLYLITRMGCILLITAVILAAGTSSRMGRCKQLLLWKGKPLVWLAAEAALASPADEVLVVTGCQAGEVKAALDPLPVKTVFNPAFATGQGSSLAAGIKAASHRASAFVVLLADQPQVTAAIVGKLIAAYQQSRPLALRPNYRGQPGHPVVISAALRPQLEALSGDKGARSLLASLGDKVMDLEIDDPGIVFDIDTPADYPIFSAKSIRH